MAKRIKLDKEKLVFKDSWTVYIFLLNKKKFAMNQLVWIKNTI